MALTAELPATSGEARDRVLALLRAGHLQIDDVVVADALLITSELVTNALRHAGGVTGFTVRISDDSLEVTVEDASPLRPFVPSDTRDGRIGGYGWSLVGQLATSVVITSTAFGKGIHVALRLR
ncbi:ATP-binding protein [Streptomyces lunalinharesii]|uniref:ATP-binding protein n=1 Tax=Streptomyces lunalinharesii TaxID=333384 RepID=A0ABN3RUI2_9ACTN